MNEIKNRLQAPTPPFFKKLKYAGMMLAAVGGTLLTAPVVLPAAIITIAGYAMVAGSVVAAVSQVTKE